MGEISRYASTQYTTVPGYFMQDDSKTDPFDFDYTVNNFGLINRNYESDGNVESQEQSSQWQRFEQEVKRLNSQAGPNVQYKVLYLGRHGEGTHNVALAHYGLVAWEEYWSKLEGDGKVIWADAHLTAIGRAQAQAVNAFWKQQIKHEKIPTARTYYVSPLTRCCMTAQLSFDALDLPFERPFVPEIKELLRETIGIHTCDRRSGKTYIHDNFPSYTFEADFAEEDTLWKADYRESDAVQDARLALLLDDVFENDKSTFISLTSHSGSISSVLRVIGHREFPLMTGGVIPVLVKAETDAKHQTT